MKVLLIQPDYQRKAPSPEELSQHLLPSYPLILLSEILANAGHQAQVLDGWSNWMLLGSGSENDLGLGAQKLLEKEDFDLAGISVYTPLRKEAVELARLIKKKSPKTKIVFGGPHPSRLWHSMLSAYQDDLDFILKGGAEQSFAQLADNLEGKGTARFRIPGLAWRSETEGIRSNSNPVINLDLSSQPAVKFNDYFAKAGSDRIDRAYIVTSRGCKRWCNYCSQLWKKALYHPPDRAVEEARRLIQDFQASELVIYDDCLGMNPAHSAEIFQKISRFNHSSRLIGISHFQFLEKAWLEHFKNAGGYALCIGLGSGSGKLRRKMNNYIEDESICQGVELIRSLGIKLGIYIMIGFPSETPEDLAKTRELLQMIAPEQVIATVYDLKPGDILIEFGIKAEMLRETDYLNLGRRLINYLTEEEMKEAAGTAEFFETRFTKEILLKDSDPAWWILGLDQETRERMKKKAEAGI